MSQVGCVDGAHALTNILLDRHERNLSVKSITIHKRLDIFKNGRKIFRLDEQLTRPIGHDFIVEDVKDYEDSMWTVSLKDPKSTRKRKVRKRKLETEDNDTDEETPYSDFQNTKNPFLFPQSIPEHLLQNLTGLSKGKFGDYCAKLANAGVKKIAKRRKLSLECMALLERTKMRQAIDDRVLQLMFDVSLATTYNYFWEIQLKETSPFSSKIF